MASFKDTKLQEFRDFYANTILPRLSGEIVGTGDEIQAFILQALDDYQSRVLQELEKFRAEEVNRVEMGQATYYNAAITDAVKFITKL